MEYTELQVENGNFTRIINPLIEKLIQMPFKGCEIAVALFIIRKTFGYNKLKDEISLTQFEKGLKRGRPTIVKALKNLQLVNIAKLVKYGDSKKCANLWQINKYFETWELVKLAELVKTKRQTSKDGLTTTSKDGLTHKRQYIKTITKDNNINKQPAVAEEPKKEINQIMEIFYKINPTLNWGNKTTRKACEDLIKAYGLEQTLELANYAVSIQGQPYSPTITTPYQLKEKASALLATWKKNNSSNIINLDNL